MIIGVNQVCWYFWTRFKSISIGAAKEDQITLWEEQDIEIQKLKDYMEEE